jgi:hypothetical protein
MQAERRERWAATAEEERKVRTHTPRELGIDEDQLGSDPREVVDAMPGGARRRAHHLPIGSRRPRLERYGIVSFAWTTACVARPLFVTGQTYQRYVPGVSRTVLPS